MNKQRGVIIFFLLFLLISIKSTDLQQEKKRIAETGVIVENYDGTGRAVSKCFRTPPGRVVTVWQNSVETLLALGLKDKIVAAVGVPYPECIKEEYRKEYSEIPIKQFQLLDTESLLMLSPNLIVAWASTFSYKVTKPTEFWEQREVQTYVMCSSLKTSKAKTIQDEYEYIRDMGRIFRKEEQAEAIVGKMERKISMIKQQTVGREKPKTLILELMKDSVMTYDKKTLAGDIAQQVGGEVIDTEKSIGYEQIIQENPDVIFFVVSESNYASADNLLDEFMKKQYLQSVNAVRNRRVYVAPLFMVYGSGVRTYEGICLMVKGLHPDLQEGREGADE